MSGAMDGGRATLAAGGGGGSTPGRPAWVPGFGATDAAAGGRREGGR
jgi:hypothetical protein